MPEVNLSPEAVRGNSNQHGNSERLC